MSRAIKEFIDRVVVPALIEKWHRERLNAKAA